MERSGPDLLRDCADALEDERRLENVVEVRRCEELDQNMLLALNGARGKRSRYKDGLPDAGVIIKWLKEKVIEVKTPNGQGVKLGAFYTNLYPLHRRPRVIIGIFPLFHPEVEYTIRPRNPSILKGYGSINVLWETISGKDPMFVSDRRAPGFLFYRKSPFRKDSPYRTKEIRADSYYVHCLPEAELYELALEQNIIDSTLYTIKLGRRPRLFKQSGFTSYINSHASEERYIKLHAAYTQRRCK